MNGLMKGCTTTMIARVDCDGVGQTATNDQSEDTVDITNDAGRNRIIIGANGNNRSHSRRARVFEEADGNWVQQGGGYYDILGEPASDKFGYSVEMNEFRWNKGMHRASLVIE